MGDPMHKLSFPAGHGQSWPGCRSTCRYCAYGRDFCEDGEPGNFFLLDKKPDRTLLGAVE